MALVSMSYSSRLCRFGGATPRGCVGGCKRCRQQGAGCRQQPCRHGSSLVNLGQGNRQGNRGPWARETGRASWAESGKGCGRGTHRNGRWVLPSAAACLPAWRCSPPGVCSRWRCRRMHRQTLQFRWRRSVVGQLWAAGRHKIATRAQVRLGSLLEKCTAGHAGRLAGWRACWRAVRPVSRQALGRSGAYVITFFLIVWIIPLSLPGEEKL